jgi:hypothetical protein
VFECELDILGLKSITRQEKGKLMRKDTERKRKSMRAIRGTLPGPKRVMMLSKYSIF